MFPHILIIHANEEDDNEDINEGYNETLKNTTRVTITSEIIITQTNNHSDDNSGY